MGDIVKYALIQIWSCQRKNWETSCRWECSLCNAEKHGWNRCRNLILVSSTIAAACFAMIWAVSRYITLCNGSCNLFSNVVARHVARKILQCNTDFMGFKILFCWFVAQTSIICLRHSDWKQSKPYLASFFILSTLLNTFTKYFIMKYVYFVCNYADVM